MIYPLFILLYMAGIPHAAAIYIATKGEKKGMVSFSLLWPYHGIKAWLGVNVLS